MKVSIVVTCYNRERFIGRAIRSAISQRFPKDEFEVVVVDDGSGDNSPRIIGDFGDLVVPILLPANQGLPSARNAGARHARGRYVVFLDSDDYVHEDFIYVEHLHMAMNPEWGAVACDYFEVDDLERHTKRCDAGRNPIACGIMFRLDSLVEIGLYDASMLLMEDREIRARFEQRFHVGHVRLPLYRYTRHSGNLTNDRKAVRQYRRKLAAKVAAGGLEHGGKVGV